MRQAIYVVFLAFLVVSNTINCDDTGHKEPDLEIHNLFKPDDCQRKAKATDIITVHYKGTLENGRVFDSSYERNEPFHFQIGLGKVIMGWEKGLLNSCAGEKLKLVVPPHLGYGDVANEKIPAKSTLIFEIEVIKVEDGPKPVNIFKEIDADGDKMIARKEMMDFLKKQQLQAQQHGDVGSLEDPDQMDMIEEIFMHEDKDKDGFISYDEFHGPKYDHDEL